MIFLITPLLLCFILALFQPYGSRLAASGLWLGKALVPPDQSGLYPRGLQDALTDGSISRLTFVISMLPYPVCALGFLYAWWAPVVSLAFYLVVTIIAGLTNLASKRLDYYLNAIHTEIQKRRIKYELAGDRERAEIISDLSLQVSGVLGTYFNSGVPAPSFSEAKKAPFGDEYYLLDKFEKES